MYIYIHTCFLNCNECKLNSLLISKEFNFHDLHAYKQRNQFPCAFILSINLKKPLYKHLFWVRKKREKSAMIILFYLKKFYNEKEQNDFKLDYVESFNKNIYIYIYIKAIHIFM
jgi:hypothetical protein